MAQDRRAINCSLTPRLPSIVALAAMSMNMARHIQSACCDLLSRRRLPNFGYEVGPGHSGSGNRRVTDATLMDLMSWYQAARKGNGDPLAAPPLQLLDALIYHLADVFEAEIEQAAALTKARSRVKMLDEEEVRVAPALCQVTVEGVSLFMCQRVTVCVVIEGGNICVRVCVRARASFAAVAPRGGFDVSWWL